MVCERLPEPRLSFLSEIDRAEIRARPAQGGADSINVRPRALESH